MRIRINAGACAFAAMVLIAPAAARAEPAIGGGVTITYQTPSDNRVDNEVTSSIDLTLDWRRGSGIWRIYIEGNSTPNADGVSGILPEANADTGSALDDNRRGRAQISELKYSYAFDDRRMLTAGLVDVSGYFDQSRIASDENTQFLGISFVLNPTIEFPDYTLGVIYEHALSDGFILRAALTGTHGMADNPKSSYSQLVDVADEDKGVFAIVSAIWKFSDGLLRGGVWTRTDHHDSLDGTKSGLYHHGVFLLADHEAAPHRVNLRLGFANEEVARAARFVGLSYQYRRAPFAFGAGAARSFLSEEEPTGEMDDTTHIETYLRYAIRRNVYLTADIQRIINSGFETSGSVHDRTIIVYGLRMTYVLE